MIALATDIPEHDGTDRNEPPLSNFAMGFSLLERYFAGQMSASGV